MTEDEKIAAMTEFFHAGNAGNFPAAYDVLLRLHDAGEDETAVHLLRLLSTSQAVQQ